jgi:hypothetical protein
MSDKDLEHEASMLRATSDGLMLSINEISVRELMKRGTKPSDPGFSDLARQVRVTAEVILELARKEEAIAVQTAAEPHVASLPAIATVTPGASLTAILEQWRAVEQRLRDADPGSNTYRELMVEFDRLRRSYAEAVEAKRREPERR